MLGLIFFLAVLVLIKSDMGKHYHNLHNTLNITVEKPWELLKEVDGLRNEDVVILVSSSQVKQFAYLRGRIIPSSRTWMKMFANVFVVVEDTFQARFALRHCAVRETPHFTSFDCHHEPTYVLSRKCTAASGGGPGPCCKVDDLFSYLIFDRPEVFAHTKYAIHCDDDTYFRPDQVLRYLAQIEASGVNTYPIVGSPNLNDPKEHVYGTQGCEEIHTNGWYQPLFINHAAMNRAKFGFAAYGTMETCMNFEVTHDVGLGPFFWEFQLWRLPFYQAFVGNHDTNIGNVVTHAVRHGNLKDSCDKIENFGEDQRHNQKVLIGCGTVDEPMKNHVPGSPDGNNKMYNDMYDLWNYFKVHGEDVEFKVHGYPNKETYKVTLYPEGTMLEGISTTGDEKKLKIKHILMGDEKPDAEGKFNGDPVVERELYIMIQLVGYETTPHSKQYDITKEWKSFKRTDCAIKGHRAL